MSKFEEFQAFIAVVDAGSFTAAADRMDSAKSALSRRVAALERRLGVQLLHRTTRVLNLTRSGRGFYDQGRRILADLEEAESAVRRPPGELGGTLRLALPLSFGVRHMCGPIATFSKQHPKVSFELDLNDRRVDLIEESFDMAVRIGDSDDSSLITRRLFDVRAVVCASPHYLNVHGKPETPDDLRYHQCLVPTNVHDPERWVWQDGEGNTGAVKIKRAMAASNGDFLCNAAAHGLGVVIQPAFIASQAIRSGNLVPVLTNYQFPVSPAYAVCPPTRYLSFRVRAFIDFLAEKFAGSLQWERDSKLSQ